MKGGRDEEEERKAWAGGRERGCKGGRYGRKGCQ